MITFRAADGPKLRGRQHDSILRGSVAIHRRQFIGGILACGCGTPFAAAEEQSRFRVGCYAGDGEQGASKYKASTGVSAYDSTVRSALDSVGRVMGRPVGAKLAFIEENNAHFNPPASLIAFGKLLLDGLQGPDFALKVTCIAAHEVAHIIQFEDGYFDVALSDATVKNHVHNVLTKLRLTRRHEAMRRVRDEPWIAGPIT